MSLKLYKFSLVNKTDSQEFVLSENCIFFQIYAVYMCCVLKFEWCVFNRNLIVETISFL